MVSECSFTIPGLKGEYILMILLSSSLSTQLM